MNAIPINHHLSTVSDGTNSAAYSYLANSPLVDHLVFANNGSNVMTSQNTYDNLNRLTGKTSVLNFNYQYNAASQRTKVTLVDGSYWLFGYDALGQLTSGIKHWSDGTVVAGQQFDYAFDTIGNRTGTQAGGNQAGAGLRMASYTNNSLNQITSRGVPGDVDVMGLTLANNPVSVNGTNAYQKGLYFREQMATNNTSAAQWVGITVTATNQAPVSGGVFVAKTPENMTYDLDGNLTQDGRWTYTWDGENRLIAMTSLTGAPTASQYSLAFTYDYMGRRIQKVVSTNGGSGYGVLYTNRYLYDGWNLVAILDQSSSLVASFMWGTDLSGSMQGASGVGGLISMTVPSGTNAGTYFYCYDGNGNVVALVNAANGSIAANYEYGPFGELIRATGPISKVNPFGWSDKTTDPETGLVYYGYRYYNPSTGRWLSRDPIEEKGGVNLYEAMLNSAPNDFDRDGRDNDYGGSGNGSYDNNIVNIVMTVTPVKKLVQHNNIPQITLPGRTVVDAYYVTSEPTGQIAIDVAPGGTDPIAVTGLTASATIAGGFVVFEMPEICDTFIDVFSVDETVYARRVYTGIGSTGQIGEDYLATLDGAPRQFFGTTRGARFVDRLVNGVAHESKVGYQTLTPEIRLQVAKDAELLQRGDVQGVNWWFFRSPVTGLGGPPEPLLNSLGENGISVIIK